MPPENKKDSQPTSITEKQPPPATPLGNLGPCDGPDSNPQADLMGRGSTSLLGIYLVALGIALIYLTFAIWPPDFKVAAKAANLKEDEKDVPTTIIFFSNAVPSDQPQTAETTTASRNPVGSPGKGQGVASATTKEVVPRRMSYSVDVSYDRRLLLLVMVVSALGSFIHIASSFADFVGNRRLTRSWMWWYLLRPYVGMPLGVLFYFVVRAGFLSSGGSAGEVNRFGIAAVAGLVGMFSVKAADKLKELFDALFKTETQRKDALANPVPAVQSIQPSKQIAGAQFVNVVVSGSGFVETSVVKVEGVGRETTFRNPKELSVKLLAQDIAKARTVKLTVSNPPPGGGVSDPAVLELENPAPIITNIESIEGGKKLRVVGYGFMADSVVTLDGAVTSSADTSFINATEITITHHIESGGKVEIEVSNPMPGGGISKKSFSS